MLHVRRKVKQKFISLFLVFSIFDSLALLLSTMSVTPAFYGLSTVLGTTVLGTTVLGTTVLGTTVLGTTSMLTVYAEALSMGQLAISLVAIGMMVFLELSDPSFGEANSLVKQLRKSWLPLTALLVLVFAIIAFFRVWNILV